MIDTKDVTTKLLAGILFGRKVFKATGLGFCKVQERFYYSEITREAILQLFRDSEVINFGLNFDGMVTKSSIFSRSVENHIPETLTL